MADNNNIFKNFTYEQLDSFYGVDKMNDLTKADDNILSTVAGYFNAIYGRTAYSQLNEEAVTLSMLAKKAWGSSGWRMRIARGFTFGDRGVAQGGNIGDTVKSTIVQVSTAPKTMDLAVGESVIFQLLNGDDKYAFESEMQNTMSDHMKDMNRSLLASNETAAGLNFESIDRVCSSAGEVAAITGLAANDIDMYGLDRDVAGIYDAYVDHNSGTPRALTIDILRAGPASIGKTSGKKPNIMLTGADQQVNIVNLFQSETRYGNMPETRVSMGMNGVFNVGGQELGLTVYSFDQIPVIVDTDVYVETAGGSRIYYLNTESIFLGMLRNTKLNVVDQEALGQSYNRKAIFSTIGELIATQFNCHGKIRDLL